MNRLRYKKCRGIKNRKTSSVCMHVCVRERDYSLTRRDKNTE